ncbi:uncharacterized protein V1513DRAFT_467133 [Lipomyces chichibuensis]|uniref:uncharacterized protein n=1 Tax=Lipomyces chichibuensis TaxID=1546026 RepID=UPI0033435FDE
MTPTNKRSRREAIQPSQIIEPLEEDTITVSPSPPSLPEERFEYLPPPDSEDPFNTPLPSPSAFESGPVQRLDLSKQTRKALQG